MDGGATSLAHAANTTTLLPHFRESKQSLRESVGTIAIEPTHGRLHENRVFTLF